MCYNATLGLKGAYAWLMIYRGGDVSNTSMRAGKVWQPEILGEA